MARILIILSIMSLRYTAWSSSVTDKYLNDYSTIAVSEMERTGIPASIKLAQALLESDWGRSDLAVQAHNHFGIKCGGGWKGKTYYKEDDDRNDKGEMIKSCFRVFDDPYESFIAHSDFLTDPRKEYRYGGLFKLKRSDYKSWAKGLRKSGYATDPKYPDKLIEIIERYNLHAYDDNHNHVQEVVKELDANIEIIQHKTREPEITPATPEGHNAYLQYKEINRCRVVVNNQRQSIEDIAGQVGETLEELLAYNESFFSGDHMVEPGAFIYLDKKKRSYRGGEGWHKVKPGETMQSISQLYGIQLRSLYAKNRMPRGSETIPGEKLNLSKTVSRKERPKFAQEDNTRSHEFLFEED